MPFITQHKKIILSSVIGSALEAYDFMIYIFFSLTISKVFFTNQSFFMANLKTLGIFAIGYLARPIGGIIFAHFGDKYGRKVSFISSIIIMLLASLAIGILPSYAQIGNLAPILLLFFRLLQGFSFGGEVPGSITFLSEHINKNKQGFAGSSIFLGINLGLMIASLVGSLMTSNLNQETILNWAWRIPFILGGIFGLFSFVLRKSLTETNAFHTLKKENKIKNIPLLSLLTLHKKEILYSIALISPAAITIFFFTYMPSYLSIHTNFLLANLLILNTIATLIFSLTILLVGYLSDLIKHRIYLYLSGAIFVFIFSFIIFRIFTYSHFFLSCVAYLLFAISSAIITGTYPAIIANIFPNNVRYSGISFSYNISFAIFGGLSPIICTLLQNKFNDISFTGSYISAIFFICIIVILYFQRNQFLKRTILIITCVLTCICILSACQSHPTSNKVTSYTSIENLNESFSFIKNKSELPLLFPNKIPIPVNSKFYAFSGVIKNETNNLWWISIKINKDCTQKGCNILEITATKDQEIEENYYPALYEGLESNKKIKKEILKLSNGSIAYFTPAHAEADWHLPKLEWIYKAVLYSISWNEKNKQIESKKILLDMVNSVLLLNKN